MRDLEIDYRKKPDPDSGPTVAGIDLDVHAGEVVALVGESGSGKSTIAWAVAGLRRPSGGEIRLADDDATAEGLDLTVSAARRSPSVRRRIQLIFQNADTSLNPRRTVGDAVTRPIKVFGLADDHGALVARRDQAFDDVGLPAQFAGRIPGQLSGGQRQRIGIARAVAAGPTLVLADEVVSALDVSVQASVLRLMEDLRGEYRLGYLFISHDLAVVRGLADRVIVLYLGRICEEGPVDEVYSLRANHPYTSLLMASVLGPHGAGGPAVSEQQSEPASAPPPEGCPFFHRCSERIEGTCEVGVPPWREVSSRHRIRCHLSLETLGHREGSH